MRKTLLQLILLLACFLTIGCAEEVVPATEDFQEVTEYKIDNMESTDGEEEDPGILPSE